MLRRSCFSLRMMVICVFLTTPLFAQNHVRIESASISQGCTDTIGVFITNDRPIRHHVVPLVVRSLTGDAFWTQVDTLPWNIRPGIAGFVDLFTEGMIDLISPDQFYLAMVGAELESELFIGTDEPSSPMVQLAITVNYSLGEFEIDTMVFPPNVPLLFSPGPSDPSSDPFAPTFTNGTITIVPCNCPFLSDHDEDGFLTGVDLAKMVDILYAGHVDVQDAGCPAPRADFDCDGFSTGLDLAGLIDHLYAGGDGPCDPCAP